MKKLGLLIGFCCSFGMVNAQVSLGTGAGTGSSTSTFLGYYSGSSTTTGTSNVGVGIYSLTQNVSGSDNIAIGKFSLYNNITSIGNIAIGSNALKDNISHLNTAIGFNSMSKNEDGANNTAVGANTLENNTEGGHNTSIGYKSMEVNTTGSYNTSNGAKSLPINTSGDRNTAMGYSSMEDNTTGKWNTGIGFNALRNNETGRGNTALGYWAGTNEPNYSYSTALGAFAISTASYQVRVGYVGVRSIGGSQNWTNLSDGRFKKEVEEDVMGLDFIKALRPVSYYVDNEAVNEFLGVELEKEAINNKKQYQTGFIAQEVEATAKELGFEHFGGVDVPVNDKSHYGLRYAEFVVPLVKSVQELSEQNEDLKALIATQQVQINELLEAKNANLNTAIISSQSQAVLYQNAPNPFSHETQIKLFIPVEVGQAFIQVCTIDGKQLFVKEVTGRSETSVMLEAGDLSAGIYMYTLVVDSEIVDSKRMMLTK